MTRITHYTLRITSHISRFAHFKLNTLVILLIFAAAFYAYTFTLAPTVIEGDAALFQFTPYVLGVTYPTGFPLYILLGKLWLTLFPFGEIAWRMNLFSALCSSLALPFIYNAARRLINYQLLITNTQRVHSYQLPTTNSQFSISSWAALLTTITFATLPTFWRWSTEAKTYALNILFFSLLLYTLAHALENVTPKSPNNSSLLAPHSSLLPPLLLGLMISVHNTGVLLIPGYGLLIWLNLRHYFRSIKSIILHLIALALPGLFYLYIPFRAEWLIARYTRQQAIERGLLADFYHSGLSGLLGYFSGVGFTEGVVSNWGLVPQQFFTVYMPLLNLDFTSLGIGLGLIGGVRLAVTTPRLFWPLFLMYAVPIPFVIVYGQGEQSAFLLPSFLIFCIFIGNTVTAIAQFTHYALHNTQYALNAMLLLLFLGLIPFLIIPQIQHNLTWLTVKWNRDIYNQWADALNHPLETNAGMLAHWGDLTSFWYMQHADGRRPDLRGVYPPTEEIVLDWYKRGNNDLYIAGPLQGWAEGIQERYHLIPWGRLVRIAPRQADPQSLLPNLSQPIETTFGNQLRLLGVEYDLQAIAGYDYPITLAWQTLAELPPETTISLRLSQNGLIVAQLDDRLRSGWFPSPNLPANQPVLSYALLPAPLGTLPGHYRLQLVAYTDAGHPWPLPDGSAILDLGPIEIVPPGPNDAPATGNFKPLPGHDFNGEIELIGYNYSVARVGQGKGFALQLLWQAITQPKDNYTLRVEALDAEGNVLRAVEHQPIQGRAPTASWRPGQYIRDQVDFVAPAGAPPGENALQMRLSWLRPDGSKLTMRCWKLLPLADGLKLGWLDVTPKKERVFELPPPKYPVDANLENKVRLLGYNTPLTPGNAPNGFTLNRSTCGDCVVQLELIWQGISEMDKLYQVFTHLVDDQGRLVAQHDGVPGLGKQPTTGWLPGEIVADPIEISLPADIAAGQYTIRVGLYLPPHGPRLLIIDDKDRPVSDFLDIAVLEIASE
jgi:hypothetical protein